MALYGSSTTTPILETPLNISNILGPEDSFEIVNGIGLLDTDMYMSAMHGGHGGGKTSSFKRCLFLNNISAAKITKVFAMALNTCPSPLCYIHLVQGGGAIRDKAIDTTAFGCREWDFASVITGVWPRDRDGTESSEACKNWVYQVVKDLLPLSTGAYGADLGPDPRDAELAPKAFGPNRPRLLRLKASLDPQNTLAYACPLLKSPPKHDSPRLIILVTGETCAGKDFCAEIWAASFDQCTGENFKARVVSISDKTKREYAAATGADLNRLYEDRSYKDKHRGALTEYFHNQVQQQPQLPVMHFLDVVRAATDVDVLFVTGLRDEAPVTALSHVATHCRLLEVYVKASDEVKLARRGGPDDSHQPEGEDSPGNGKLKSLPGGYRPGLTFDNDEIGSRAARTFAEKFLIPFLDEDLQRLASMIRPAHDFPRQGIEFRHVLDIVQRRGGLALCTSLLKRHFNGVWSEMDFIATVESGSFVFAAPLALEVDVPLVLIRKDGKLAPPVLSVRQAPSHISSEGSSGPKEKIMEMNHGRIQAEASVVVVDDVLATGHTLCAVLQLLEKAGVDEENIRVMVVAEFPVHRGRALLHRSGFGGVLVQSLLVFDGV